MYCALLRNFNKLENCQILFDNFQQTNFVDLAFRENRTFKFSKNEVILTELKSIVRFMFQQCFAIENLNKNRSENRTVQSENK